MDLASHVFSTGSLRLRRVVYGYRLGGGPGFDELHSRAGERLAEIAGRIAPPGVETDDLLQQAWTGQLGRMLRPDGPDVADSEHFFRLAARAIGQAAADLARKARRRVRLFRHATDPAGPLVDESLAMDIQAALAELPETARRVVSLKIVEDLSRRQTADELGLTEAQVRTDLKEALAALAGPLSAYGPE